MEQDLQNNDITAEEKEINILLLGETGVGKSTFINAFVNYLKFDTLDEAKLGNMKVLIPSKFVVIDENYEEQEIKVGIDNKNEQLENVGMTATQECKSYVFPIAENMIVRLIDTPGVGDTRGIAQDKINFDNILQYIGQHQHLNGICILLKPNNAQLNVVFQFCIQELLSHLHRDAKDNIVFCFTNARPTSYRPEDTLLKKQLNELSNVEIITSRSTVYCFDNESFRFLSLVKKNVSFTKEDEESFNESWKRSAKESERLLQYLVTRTPLKVKDNISLNNARDIVVPLFKPLAKIGQIIQPNIGLVEEQQKEIHNCHEFIEQLKKVLQEYSSMVSSGNCEKCHSKLTNIIHVTTGSNSEKIVAIEEVIKNESTSSDISLDEVANPEQQVAERAQSNASKYEEKHYKLTRDTRPFLNIF